MKITLVVAVSMIMSIAYAQEQNFIDQPYVETRAIVDTSVVPDHIYLSILITEKDTKGKISVENLEIAMVDKIKSLGVDLSTQLTVKDFSSNFRNYVLKRKDILKSKSYALLLYDAMSASEVIVALEDIGLSNVSLDKTEYSRMDELSLHLKSQAIVKAKKQGEAMLRPLNLKLGRPLYISDNYVRTENLAGVVSGYTYDAAYTKRNAEFYQPSIEFRKINVETEVIVRFKIE